MTVRTGFHVALVLVLTSAAGQAGARPGADPWLIVPGVRVGAITRAAGELDLIRAFTRTGRVILRLRPPAGKSTAPVRGGREFRSSHRAMRQINPRVYQMIIEFR